MPSSSNAKDASPAVKKCPFCDLGQDVVLENDHAFAIYDGYPVSEGHMLVIPRRHVTVYFGMSAAEKSACWELVERVRTFIMDRYHPSGINVGFNCGESAGQTVFHAHIHVIPRYDGDTPNPRGGVRRVVADKGDYAWQQRGR